MDYIKIDTLPQLLEQFPTEKACRAYHEQRRWKYGVACPHCGSAKIYVLKPSAKGNNYKCADKHCFMRFNVLTGTIFENTKIPMLQWHKAIFLMTSHKKGISSYQLGRDIGISQKSAWFMLHRIRETFKDIDARLLRNTVEVDETFVGGKLEGMHDSKKKKFEGKDNKTPVIGMVERGGNIKLQPTNDVRLNTIKETIGNNVHSDSVIYTDSYNAYHYLKGDYAAHETVNHGAKEFVRGKVHTNTIEGAFGLFKRCIVGTWHHISPKHMGRYCSEFAFRYNMRKDSQTDRFNLAFVQAEGRLRYKDLIGKGVKNG